MAGLVLVERGHNAADTGGRSVARAAIDFLKAE
jgi:hypothetical protein